MCAGAIWEITDRGTNPAARITPLLKDVFGAIGKR